MSEAIEKLAKGYEKHLPMSRGEKVLWAAAYANCLSSGHGPVVSARTAAVRVKELREKVAEATAGPLSYLDWTDEDAHMAREVVNLEAALGPAYRERLRRVAGAVDRDVSEVDDELASCMMWLDHRGYRGAATVLRLEAVAREGYDRRRSDDQVADLEAVRDAAAAEVVRLRGLSGQVKNRG